MPRLADLHPVLEPQPARLPHCRFEPAVKTGGYNVRHAFCLKVSHHLLVAKTAVSTHQPHPLGPEDAKGLLQKMLHRTAGPCVAGPQPRVGHHPRLGHKCQQRVMRATSRLVRVVAPRHPLLVAVARHHRTVHVQCHLRQRDGLKEAPLQRHKNLLVAPLAELVKKPPVAAPRGRLLPAKEFLERLVVPQHLRVAHPVAPHPNIDHVALDNHPRIVATVRTRLR